MRSRNGADGADRAALGGGDGLRHVLAGDIARDGDGKRPLHLEYLGAKAGALGAADAEIGVDDRFHGIASFGSYCRRVCPAGSRAILSAAGMVQ